MRLAHSPVGGDVHQFNAGQVIYQLPDKAQDEAEQWERRYVQWVFEKTWRLYLDGIDEKIIGTERADCLQSAEIYTPLLTLSAETSSELAKEQERPQQERLRSAVEVLNAERRLVLLGDPGSGKSMFLNANSKQAPQIVDRQVQPILDQSEVYSGCYGRVSITFYAYNSNGNKGVAAGLGNVQKLRDGEPLGSRANAKDEFEAVDAEDDFLA